MYSTSSTDKNILDFSPILLSIHANGTRITPDEIKMGMSLYRNEPFRIIETESFDFSQFLLNQLNNNRFYQYINLTNHLFEEPEKTLSLKFRDVIAKLSFKNIELGQYRLFTSTPDNTSSLSEEISTRVEIKQIIHDVESLELSPVYSIPSIIGEIKKLEFEFSPDELDLLDSL